jgi:hypothetical protein
MFCRHYVEAGMKLGFDALNGDYPIAYRNSLRCFARSEELAAKLFERLKYENGERRPKRGVMRDSKERTYERVRKEIGKSLKPRKKKTNDTDMDASNISVYPSSNLHVADAILARDYYTWGILPSLLCYLFLLSPSPFSMKCRIGVFTLFHKKVFAHMS